MARKTWECKTKYYPIQQSPCMSFPRELVVGAIQRARHSGQIKEDKHPVDLRLDTREIIGLSPYFFDVEE
jgi:hypothetical protein